MSGEDDTFDLDIYGDEENQQQQQQQQQEENPEDRIDFGDDAYEQNGNSYDGQQDNIKAEGPSAGQKRKAPDDGYDDHHNAAAPTGPRPTSQQGQGQVDPNATQALKLSELNWWTTEEDLRAFCNSAGVESQLTDIAFGEHKINGKSRGEAYLEFDTSAAANAVKFAFEQSQQGGVKQETTKKEESGTPAPALRSDLAKARVWYVDHRQGNPFKGRDSGQATKKDAGAYNSAPVRGGFQAGRGGFVDRGRGGFQRGGGFQARGGFQQNQNAFNMNGNFGGGGYGGMGGMMGNPMMAMGMGGMGFQNNFRGGMMGMAGRGNFNNARGGYGMNAAAGFRGGFQGNQGFQQQQQGGFQQQQQGHGMQAGANKRPRQE